MEQNNNTKTTSTVNETTNKAETSANKTTRNKETDNYKFTNKINMDYDWNSEYGDGDIPDIDK
ncbi:hypothetical protein SAMN02746066_03879 [Anaerosporobacter mobilis DSM 15930]|uniref:Uncharacterized protein n=1 Tax=Anaerosporobacter mobilis DSM 15930 TaxID=1120996 RepID=A0A1M7MJN6_9FIRM|nr:hypothetical protein [Anaerosporobacter mobilis]SHM91232.1 hypothetical protein SAMN02746066_03879 [Anaerosporobacter mobilis DSM 15930]